MLAWLRARLTYANVLVTILLFFVLGGGGAYALSGHNRVKSDDIAPGAVRQSDLADSTGKTYSNAITLGVGGARKRYMAIPGFGKLEATSCTTNSVVSRLTNTSSSSFRLDYFVDANGNLFQNAFDRSPGEQFNFSSTSPQFLHLQLVRGSGASTQMATITAFNVSRPESENCAFDARAIVQR